LKIYHPQKNLKNFTFYRPYYDLIKNKTKTFFHESRVQILIFGLIQNKLSTVSINAIFDDIKMWRWTRKIILYVLRNPSCYHMEQSFSLWTTKFFNYRLWGFQKCRL